MSCKSSETGHCARLRNEELMKKMFEYSDGSTLSLEKIEELCEEKDQDIPVTENDLENIRELKIGQTYYMDDTISRVTRIL